MRPVAIFRFSPTEGPGHFGEWLSDADDPDRTHPLDEGAAVPDRRRTRIPASA